MEESAGGVTVGEGFSPRVVCPLHLLPRTQDQYTFFTLFEFFHEQQARLLCESITRAQDWYTFLALFLIFSLNNKHAFFANPSRGATGQGVG